MEKMIIVLPRLIGKSSDMYLSIVIPVYNEERRLQKGFDKLDIFFQSSWKAKKCEVIFVDDGSTDATVEKIEQYLDKKLPYQLTLLKNDKNRGKGAVIKQGMLQAGGKYVLFSDIDFSAPLKELNNFLPYLEKKEADIVIGSRALKRELVKKHQPFYREFLGRFFNLVVRLFYLPHIKDTQCGFKLFTRQAVQKIFPKQQLDSFIFDVEILWLARKNELVIKEVPVEWTNSSISKFSPNLRNAWIMWWDFFRIGLLH